MTILSRYRIWASSCIDFHSTSSGNIIQRLIYEIQKEKKKRCFMMPISYIAKIWSPDDIIIIPTEYKIKIDA